MPRFDDISKKVTELHHEEEEALIKTLSVKYGHQYINLFGVAINTEALRLISEEAARIAECAIFARAGTKLSVALRNPNKREAQALIESLESRHFSIITYMASTASLEHVWERYHDVVHTTASEHGAVGITAEEIARMASTLRTVKDVTSRIAEISDSADRNTVSLLLTTLLGGALSLSASDMHVEPEENITRIRYRLDGVLWDVGSISPKTSELLRTRLKLLAGVKVNVGNRAQDGRFTIHIEKKEYEIRASIIPSAYGESLVLRFLDPSSITVDIKNFGINQYLLTAIEEELKRPDGIIITTGPTGSGKTTALYAFLRLVHTPEVKIITIEDPVEYHLEGIVQTQTSEEYTFASGLRSILRQDPDVIMVGEIRDREVAETAMNAALTGHLVFSTLHTNDAAGAFPRLRDLGIDPRTMGSALNLVMAQRLVRILCPVCKKARALKDEEKKRFIPLLATYPEKLSLEGDIYEPVGCDQCGGSGFKGRIGIYEGIRMTPAVTEVVIENLSERAILEAAIPQNIPTMQQDGIVKVLNGVTSLTELERVVDLYNTHMGRATEPKI